MSKLEAEIEDLNLQNSLHASHNCKPLHDYRSTQMEKKQWGITKLCRTHLVSLVF